MMRRSAAAAITAAFFMTAVRAEAQETVLVPCRPAPPPGYAPVEALIAPSGALLVLFCHESTGRPLLALVDDGRLCPLPIVPTGLCTPPGQAPAPPAAEQPHDEAS